MFEIVIIIVLIGLPMLIFRNRDSIVHLLNSISIFYYFVTCLQYYKFGFCLEKSDA